MAVLQNISERINAARDVAKFKMGVLREALREDHKGWVICLCVLIITIVRSGITYSFGVFMVDLESIYHRSIAEQNWIGTLSFCISLSFAPVSVAFIRALKYRGYRIGGMLGAGILGVSCMGSSFVGSIEWMFLTHSLLYGVGSSLIYMASSLVIGEYFDKDHKYHVLATSILLCGYPIGSLLFNPINAFLVTAFGWRVAFRCASILTFIAGATCCWSFSSKEDGAMELLNEEEEDGVPMEVKPPPKLQRQETYTPEEKRRMERRCCTVAEIMARPEIILWYLGNCLSYLGFFMPFLNLAFYMERKGIGPEQSAWCLTLLSLAECITYIVASMYGDTMKGRLVYVNVVASTGLACICLIWPLIDVNYGMICCISMVMGGFLGLTIVYTYAASGEVTGLPIDIAWSFTNLWSGIGILCGPFFSGAIFDWRQSYDDVFYVVGVLYLIDIFIFAGIPILARYRGAHDGLLTGLKGQPPVAQVERPDNNYQTFQVSNRSHSKSSLQNGDLHDAAAHETDSYDRDYNNTQGNTVMSTQNELPPSSRPPSRPPPPPRQYTEERSGYEAPEYKGYN